MFDNDTLALAAELFPSLETLDLDGPLLTSQGLNEILIKFQKLRFLSINCAQVMS